MWARELSLKRRALADLMVVSVVPGEGYQFTVSMHNLSEASFHDVSVGYNDEPGSATWLSNEDGGGQIRDEIAGKTRVKWTAPAEVMPPPKHVFATFMDARGQRWQVLLHRSGWRYMSHRAYHKLAFNTPYNQKPLDYA